MKKNTLTKNPSGVIINLIKNGGVLYEVNSAIKLESDK